MSQRHRLFAVLDGDRAVLNNVPFSWEKVLISECVTVVEMFRDGEEEMASCVLPQLQQHISMALAAGVHCPLGTVLDMIRDERDIGLKQMRILACLMHLSYDIFHESHIPKQLRRAILQAAVGYWPDATPESQEDGRAHMRNMAPGAEAVWAYLRDWTLSL